MTITLVGSGAQASGPAGTTSLDVAYPAGLAANDLLVLVHTWNTVTQAAIPSGWTNRVFSNGGNSPSLEIDTKVASGSESGLLTIAQGGGSGNATMFAFRGVDPTTPLDTAPSDVGYGTAVTTRDIPSLTTTMVGCCLFYATSHNIFSGTEAPPTNPAAFTELYDLTTPPRSSAGYLVWNSSGATGLVSITTDTASRGGTGMIAMRPVVANTDMAGTVVSTSDVTGATPQLISKAQGTVVATSAVMGAAEGGSSGGSAGSKHDQLQEQLVNQGYTTGSLNDRLYAREKAIYNAGPKPLGNGPLSLMDYMRSNGTDPRIL